MKVITKTRKHICKNNNIFVNKHIVQRRITLTTRSYAKITEKCRNIIRESFPNNTNQFHHDTSPTNNQILSNQFPPATLSITSIDKGHNPIAPSVLVIKGDPSTSARILGCSTPARCPWGPLGGAGGAWGQRGNKQNQIFVRCPRKAVRVHPD